MPADMISLARVVIERVGMRILLGRRQQLLAADLFEPADQRLGPIELRDKRRVLVDRMAADAAALLVAREIIAIDPVLQGAGAGNQPFRDFVRQEFAHM
ncbi:hypothetical protein D3C72_1479420 [compost metagenome]